MGPSWLAGRQGPDGSAEAGGLAPLRCLRLRDGEGDPPEGRLDLEHHVSTTGGGSGIRCPRCRYRPSRDEHWACACGHLWNTFETGGVCPACGHVWTETQCPRCAAWSPHESWYEKRSIT